MALEKLTITRVSYTDKKKDGTPILSKFGKQSWKVGIKTNEYGDTWINGFLPFCPDKWEGTTQEVEIYEDEYNGVTRKNFKLPPKAGGMSDNDRAMLIKASQDSYAAITQIKALTQYLKEQGVIKDVIPGTSVEYPKGPDPKKAGFEDVELPPVEAYDDSEDPKNIPF